MDWLRKLLGRCVHRYTITGLIDHKEGDQCVATTHLLQCHQCGERASRTINFK